MDIFLQQIINGLVLGSIYALVALGYTMVYGILGLINFAHGDIVMVGALTALTVITGLAGGAVPVPLILGLALLAAMLVCMTLGVSIERVAYRPLRRAPRLAPLITAIGVSILLQYSAALIWGKQFISLPEIIRPAYFTVAGASFTDLQLFIFVLACGVMMGLLWFIRHTRIGKAMRATEQNRDVADLQRVDQRDALRAVGDIERPIEIVEENADDLAETERDNGEIIAAQLERRRAEQHAEHGGDQGAQRQQEQE